MQVLTGPKKTLDIICGICFCTITIGLWLFGAYIIGFYYRSVLAGDLQRWNEVLPHGYVVGEWFGNMLVAVHVLLALILVVGGPLQLMPFVRNRYRKFHRILGRAYVYTAILVSLAGLGMTWTRESAGDLIMWISNSIQAIYIIIFAIITIRFAVKRNIGKHNLWAVRLFLVTGGVWFFRVFLMAWLVIHGGPAGFDAETFTGPFLTFLSVFTYAVPVTLFVYELYRRAMHGNKKWLVYTASVILLLSTAIIALGIFGASIGMWFPVMGR